MSTTEPGTLPCQRAESRNFSPPPSPAIADSATFLRCRTFGASSGRDGEYSESARSAFAVNVCTKRNVVDPLGHLVSCFGYRLCGVPCGAHHLAVQSNGLAALHLAACFNNRRIVRKLIAAKADIDAQNREG